MKGVLTKRDTRNEHGNRFSIALVLTLSLLQLLVALVPMVCLAQPGPEDDSNGQRAVTFDISGLLAPSEDYGPEGYTGLFPLYIHNKGDTPGNGTITVLGLENGWSWDIVEGARILENVKVDETVRVTVQVRSTEPTPGDHAFQVKVEPGGGVAFLIASVPFMAGFEVTVPATTEGGYPNGADIEVRVTNRANGPDGFLLSIIGPSNDWGFDILPGPTSQSLAIDEEFTWHIHLKVPMGAEATVDGARGYRFLFKVVSITDPDISTANITSVFVDQYHGFMSEFRDDVVVLDRPGAVIELMTMVENLGNGPESLDVSVDIPLGWQVQYPEPIVQLYPFERRPVPIFISPPKDEVAGSYALTLRTARSDGAGLSTDTVTILIPESNGLFMVQDIEPSNSTVVPGETVSMDFMVKNKGNHLEMVEMFPIRSPDGWTVTVTPSVVSLPSGTEVLAKATIQLSKDPLKSLEGKHQVIVGTRSLFNEEDSALSLQVNVKGVASLELIAENPKKSVNPMLDPTPVYLFWLRNTGNTAVTANLEYSSDQGIADWVMPSQEAVTVHPGERAPISATIDPGKEDPAGEYQFQVSAVTDNAGGASTSTDFSISVLEKDIRMVDLEFRKPGNSRWSSNLRSVTDDHVEVLVWLECIGTDENGIVDVEVLRDGKVVSGRTVPSPTNDEGPMGVMFKVPLDEGRHNITARSSTAGEIKTQDNELSSFILAEPVGDLTTTGAAAAGVALTTILLMFGALMVNEGWKFKALSLIVVPLYTRVKKETTLDNFTRGRIFGYVEANPGVHYSAIRKALGLPNGCVAYHLDTLVREEFLKFEMDGNLKRFYPKKMRLSDEEEKPGTLSRIQAIIIDKIKSAPGLSQRQIAKALNLAPSTINYHVRVLATAGLLKLERRLGRTKCFSNE